MKKEKIEILFNRASINELTLGEQELITKAKEMCNYAYAPYSGFLVGASVLLENNKIINGNNQENVAFPSGLCAERVALFYASASYPGVLLKTIAITAIAKTFEINNLVSPCGACRQVIAEYEQNQGHPIRLLLHSPNGEVLIAESISDLLPFMFSSKQLRKF